MKKLLVLPIFLIVLLNKPVLANNNSDLSSIQISLKNTTSEQALQPTPIAARGASGPQTIAQPATIMPTNSPSPTEIKVENKTITISAIGDLTLGTDLAYGYSGSFLAKYDEVKNTKYFLENVKPILETDNLTIGNLEGPLTNKTSKASKQFAFKGYPNFVNILVDGSVEAVTIANNHAYDYGIDGYNDTVANLNSAGISNFDINKTAIFESDGVKIGLIGLKTWDDSTYNKTLITNNINDVKAKGAEIVIISFHWGIERNYYPSTYQKNLAHHAIDNGADLVLGHHPHVLQGIETYNGKNIVYSLGNFCFGGNRNPSDKDTMIYTHKFTLDKNNKIIENSSNAIPTVISSTTNHNDFKPTLAVGENKNRIANKISTLSKGLTN